MRYYHSPAQPPHELDIPAFLDSRKYATIGGERFLVLRDVEEMDLYDPRGPRKWAPIKSTYELKQKAESPAAQLYCDNKHWPVQVVTKGKNPRNLVLHDDWSSFLANHSFYDYPVEKTFPADGVTYVVVKDEETRNAIVQNAMAGGVKINQRPDLMEQNGVKRPKTGTITAAAWAKFDHMRENNIDFPTVFAELQAGGMNPSTIRTQYSHWRKFNGVPK